MSPATETIAYVILGSNVEPRRHLAAAVRMLRERADVLAASSVYQTAAQGATEGGADYLNMAVKLATPLPPADFKQQILRAIEAELGRNRATSAAVTIDLDIALWGDTAMTYGDKPWRSPSPDIARYAHVAVPLAEIAPDLIHPETGETLARIAARLDNTGIRRAGAL